MSPSPSCPPPPLLRTGSTPRSHGAVHPTVEYPSRGTVVPPWRRRRCSTGLYRQDREVIRRATHATEQVRIAAVHASTWSPKVSAPLGSLPSTDATCAPPPQVATMSSNEQAVHCVRASLARSPGTHELHRVPSGSLEHDVEPVTGVSRGHWAHNARCSATPTA